MRRAESVSGSDRRIPCVTQQCVLLTSGLWGSLGNSEIEREKEKERLKSKTGKRQLTGTAYL